MMFLTRFGSGRQKTGPFRAIVFEKFLRSFEFHLFIPILSFLFCYNKETKIIMFTPEQLKV
jgi:hypothetical protein